VSFESLVSSPPWVIGLFAVLVAVAILVTAVIVSAFSAFLQSKDD
jgi:hypothetical protein